MKRVWRNLSKGKKIAGLVVICLAVVLGYFGFHRLTSQAEEKVSHGVINDFAQLPTNMNAADGSKDNPFLILEVVPYVGKAELGYLINGCEPLAFNEHPEHYSKLYRGQLSIGNAIRRVFPEEYVESDELAYPGDWIKDTTTAFTAYGYYEKVASGQGTFKYTGVNALDGYSDKVFGAGANRYMPTFEKAEDGSGDFIWVTIGSPTDEHSGMAEKAFLDLAKSENINHASNETENITFKEGDRVYTVRTGNETYVPDGKGDYESTRHPVHFNSFIRTALNIRKKSDVDSYHIVIKTIEPKELAANPQWIDYADLIYMQQSGPTNGTGYWDKAEADGYNDLKRIKDTGTGTTASTFSSNKSNDFTWEVARKLFMKVNAMEDYDGTKQFNFAPLLWDAAITTHNDFNNSTGNVTTYPLDYSTLGIVSSYPQTLAGSNMNIYKFLVMNFMMKQENFYKFFFRNAKASDGKPVIPNEPDLAGGVYNTTGLSTAQEALAQEYWNDWTFRPAGTENAWSITQKQIDLYGLNMSGGAMLHMGTDGHVNEGLNGGTLSFNPGNTFSQLSDQSLFSADNPSLNDAFEWYRDEHDQNYSSISPLQMIFYLLNYKKSGVGGDDPGSRLKKEIKILEVEPCSEYTLTPTFLSAYLPPSKFDPDKIEIEYMTTQEFNGLKSDLTGEYDLIYIGLNTGKLNQDTNGNTVYNDTGLKRKAVVHVGDEAGDYRYSGNDISKLKRKQLEDYVNSGNALVLADKLHVEGSSGYSVNQTIVDKSSNLYKFANSNIKEKANVIALSNLSFNPFLKQYCITYQDSKIIVSETPVQYDSTKSSASLGGSTLNFTFTIGEPDPDKAEGVEDMKYGVKILMDIDYDGVVSDNDEESEVVYDSYYNVDSEASSEGDVNAPKQYYQYIYGVEGEEEKDIVYKNTHSVSFDFNTFYQNRKQPLRRNGAISWRFMVYDINNPEYYIAESGTSWYNGSSSGKMEINVYQIIDSEDKDTAVDLESAPALFTTYSENLVNYDITVETETLEEYLARFTETYPYTTDIPFSDETMSQFEDYNVFLVSCGTSLQEADNTHGAVSFITKEAENGASVLYTTKALSKDSEASEGITQGIKNILNQSRFTDSTASYVDEPTFKNSAYDLGDYASLEYTYGSVMEKGSGEYKAFSNDLWDGIEYGSEAESTNMITRENIGAVTTYPYTISSQVDVSGNIAQDFQLNMDNSQLAVWYCLGGADDSSMYGISPNDATNNYYLYTVDNVTYTGINLAEVTGAEEMQLFINTLIGNYEIGYRPPNVTVNDIKGIESEEKDCLELTLNSDSTDSLMIFDAKMPKVQKQYLEYVPSPKPIATPSSEPEPTLDPEETAGPEATMETEVSAPTPKPTPIRDLYQGNGSSTWTINVGSSHGSSMDDLADSNIIRVKYHTVAAQPADKVVYELRGQSWIDLGVYITACQGSNTDSTETQIFDISVGDLKAKGSDLSYIAFNRYAWDADVIMDSIVVYANQADADAAESSSSGSGSGGGGEPEEEASGEADYEQELASESTFIANALAANKHLSHRIYFTPYDNNVAGGNIRSLRISLVNKTEGEEDKIHSLVKTVYQDFRDITTNKRFIRKFTVGEDGNFSTKNNNFLKDNTQYYFLYDERFINGVNAGVKYNSVKFEIENRKKKGITYLNLFPDAQADNMYVFNLD